MMDAVFMPLLRFPAIPHLAAALLPLLLFTLALESAHGQDMAALNTRVYSALPEGAEIFLEPLNDSDFNLTVQKSFASALESFSYQTGSANARLNLTFETLNRFVAGTQSNMGEVEIDSANESSLRLNMWSLTKDSLFKRHADGSSSGRFLIVAILYDNEAQRRLWEAEASAPADTRNSKSRIANLVYLIVGQLGETARKDSLSLD